jgi:hypothetical protein
MTQVKSRLKKLEDQCAVRDQRSLDTLCGKAQEIAKHTGLRFEDAANELVKDLTAQELGSIVADAGSRYENLGDRLCWVDRN